MRSVACAAALGAFFFAPGARAQAGDGQPGAATVDRQDSQSKLGVDLGLALLDDSFDSADAARLEISGQYAADNGFGGYGTLAFSHLFIGDADDETAFGNIEAGGFYVAGLSQSVDLVVRGGLALPTADDDFGGIIANIAGIAPRITDIALSVPETTWLRLSTSPLVYGDPLFFRADVGVDVAVASDFEDEPDPLIRANVAGGIDTDRVAVIGEVSAVFSTDDSEAVEDNELINGAITARLHTGQIEPSLSIVIPIDESMRDTFDVSLLAGMQVLFDS